MTSPSREADVLELCRRIEMAMAQLYDRLAELHSRRDEVRELWTKTAREEDNHAAQFELLLKRPSQPGVRADSAKAEKALRAVETILASYTERAPSVEEALEEAVTLENSLAQYHAEYAVEFGDEEQRRLFRAMMAADNDHVGALRAALERERRV